MCAASAAARDPRWSAFGDRYGESAAFVACQLGQRFAVTSFIEKCGPMYADRFRSYGLGERCAGVAWTGFGFRDVLAGYAEPGPVIARFQEAARATVRATGADVLIAGEVPLSVLLASNGVTRVNDVPIVDGLATTIKMAGDDGRPGRLAGLSVSRHGWFNAAPPAERIRQMHGGSAVSIASCRSRRVAGPPRPRAAPSP
jgi:hypothetical protein